MGEIKLPAIAFDVTKHFDIPKKKWSSSYLNSIDHLMPKLSRDSSVPSITYIRKTLINKIRDGDISQLSNQEKEYRSSSNREGRSDLRRFEQRVRKHIIPIYKIDEETHKKYIDCKNNNSIALRKNFNIKHYQRSLVSFIIFIDFHYHS